MGEERSQIRLKSSLSCRRDFKGFPERGSTPLAETDTRSGHFVSDRGFVSVDTPPRGEVRAASFVSIGLLKTVRIELWKMKMRFWCFRKQGFSPLALFL